MRKLHERRWREKLGLFACEGEDLVAAATAEPVELLVAGENVEPALLAEVSTAAHPPRVIGVYRREDLPAADAAAGVLALWRVADPGNVGTLIRTADAFGAAVALSEGCADPTGPEGAARLGRGDLARAARCRSTPGSASRSLPRRRAARRCDLGESCSCSGPSGRGCRRGRRDLDAGFRSRRVAERRAAGRSRSTSGAARTPATAPLCLDLRRVVVDPLDARDRRPRLLLRCRFLAIVVLRSVDDVRRCRIVRTVYASRSSMSTN